MRHFGSSFGLGHTGFENLPPTLTILHHTYIHNVYDIHCLNFKWSLWDLIGVLRLRLGPATLHPPIDPNKKWCAGIVSCKSTCDVGRGGGPSSLSKLWDRTERSGVAFTIVSNSQVGWEG